MKNLSKYLKLFSLNSISFKIFFLILILILPLNILSIFTSNKVIDSLLDNVTVSSQSVVDIHANNLEVQMNNAQQLLYFFSTKNPNYYAMILQNEKDYDYKSAKYKFYYEFKNTASMTDGGDGYFYYMKGLDDIIVYDEHPVESGRMYNIVQDFVKTETEKGLQAGWQIYTINEKEFLFFMTDNNEVTGGSWINLDAVKQEIIENMDYDNIDIKFNEKMILDNKSKNVFVQADMKNIYLSVELDYDELIQNLSFYQRFIRDISVIYLMLIPVIIIILRILLLHPLQVLIKAHEEIQKGNQTYRIDAVSHSREYSDVYQSFNQMVDNINQLKIEQYEYKLAKQQMEIENLQLQIRPHFLLNTFSFMYTLSKRNEVEAIQDIILYLSDYFRYIFRSGKKVETFTKELHLIQGYIKMMSVFYRGNIKFDIDLDPEIMFVRVPPLLIHNFIENAVKHGYKQGEILHISLVGKYENKRVTFIVIDDGIGMKADVIQGIKESIKEKNKVTNKTSHMGILNSYKRLLHCFGENVSLEFYSEEGKVTSVEIEIPYDLEEVDESTNSK